MRKLKYHEKKLLRKVDFIDWEIDNSLHESKVLNKFKLKKREEYVAYNKLSREIRELAAKIKDLDPKDPFRTKMSGILLEKLYGIGLIPSKESLELCGKVSASSFCRRRLPVVMKNLTMAERIDVCSQFVEQGHVRVGPELVLDPAFLVTRNLEDFVTWTNSSKIREKVLEYNDARDDFELGF